MRGIMEAPFPAPGRTITVKNFLPGSGTEVRRQKVKKLNQFLSCVRRLASSSSPSLKLLFCSTGDWTVSAFGFPTGTCGLWMSLLLLESTSALTCVCLSASGAQGHLHCWQTQVGFSNPFIFIFFWEKGSKIIGVELKGCRRKTNSLRKRRSWPSVRGRNAVVLYSRLGNNHDSSGKLSWMPDRRS